MPAWAVNEALVASELLQGRRFVLWCMLSGRSLVKRCKGRTMRRKEEVKEGDVKER